jgi:hypothetical protein
MNFRIRPDTKRLLQEARDVSGRTLSQETEHQLRRALVDLGTGPTFAILKMVGMAIDALLAQQHRRANPPWVDDPHSFDQVVKAIAGALEVFRPPGARPKSDDDLIISKFEGRAAVLQLLALVRAIDQSVPIGKQTVHRRALTMLKADLEAFSLVERTGPLDTNRLVAAALRERSDHRELISKARTNPEAITPDEALQLWRLAGDMAIGHRRGEEKT